MRSEAAVLTPTEVLEAVERAERRFVETCVSATDDQWKFRPPSGAGDRAWSMPQVVEHVTAANQSILQVLRDILARSPRGDRNRDFEDDDMPYIFYGGGGAPPAGLEQPSGTHTNKAECISGFQASVRESWTGTTASTSTCASARSRTRRSDSSTVLNGCSSWLSTPGSTGASSSI